MHVCASCFVFVCVCIHACVGGCVCMVCERVFVCAALQGHTVFDCLYIFLCRKSSLELLLISCCTQNDGIVIVSGKTSKVYPSV